MKNKINKRKALKIITKAIELVETDAECRTCIALLISENPPSFYKAIVCKLYRKLFCPSANEIARLFTNEEYKAFEKHCAWFGYYNNLVPAIHQKTKNERLTALMLFREYVRTMEEI